MVENIDEVAIVSVYGNQNHHDASHWHYAGQGTRAE